MLTINEIKENCFSSSYTRGRELFLEKKFRNVEIRDMEDEDGDWVTRIRGEVKGSGNRWYNVAVDLDEDEEIQDYVCECPAYENYFGMCKHCVALALEYREERRILGSREKEGAAFEKNIRSGINHSRATSAALNTLMDRFSHQGKGYIFDQYHEDIRFEPEFLWSYSGDLSVEFKIGCKKMYVVKNIAAVLYAMDTVSNYAYGKNLSFIHDRTVFTPEALEWLDMMRDILKVSFKIDSFESYSQPYYNNTFRTINLNSYGIQKCMDHYIKTGEPVEITGKVYRVEDGTPRLKLTIQDDRIQGATLSMDPVRAFYGSQSVFIVREECIYKCDPGFGENVKPLMQAMQAIQGAREYPVIPLYLNRSDYRMFCRTMLPVLEQYLDVAVENIDFDEYVSNTVLNVYLDMDDKGAWRIRLRAQAQAGEQSFDLYGNEGMEYRDIGEEFELKQIIDRYFTLESDGGRYCSDETKVFGLVREGILKMQQLAQVFVDEKIRGIQFRPAPKVTIGIGLQSHLLELDVHTDLMDPEEIAQVLSAYKKKKRYFRLKNGDILSLDEDSLGLFAELSEGLMLSEKELASGTVTLPAFRANYVNEMVREHSGSNQVHRDTGFRKMIREMREYSDSDFDVPDSVHASLRKYQKEGFRWLCTLAAYGLGRVLADDMGLGKTLQMPAFIAYKKVKTLIVCPASLVYNWESEAARFTPDLKTVVVAGNTALREKIMEDALQADLVITSYDLLKRDVDTYKTQSFGCVVIDEAQYIKNAGTQAARSVKAIDAPLHFALTGTPIENRLSDLWSIFDFIMPGYLYTYQKFKKEFEHPVVTDGDETVTLRLRHMVSPFILRRRKQDVLKDLPDKLEKTIYTTMTPQQETVYRAWASRLMQELSGTSEKDFMQEQIRILAELTRLRQICCAPDLCLEDYSGGSGKMDACMELIDNAISGGHRILVFSQFTQMLEKLIDAYKDRGSYLYLSGKSTKEQRRQMVDQFQKGDVPVFFISLKAGGTGLNLTAADVVIHYDPWWNVAAQNQATDRTHRIGQKNVVTVLKLVAKNTIEEKILKLQEEKAKLAENIIEGDMAAQHHISRDELLELLKNT